MGYDQRSDSSGAKVAVVVAVLVVVILGILAVGGASLFWVRASRLAVAVTDADAKVWMQQQYSVAATPDPGLNFFVRIDREGNTRVDGEMIGLDELRAQIARLKEETSDAFSVQINADSECPIRHIIPVLNLCDEIGDIDIPIVSSEGSVSTSTGTRRSGYAITIRHSPRGHRVGNR